MLAIATLGFLALFVLIILVLVEQRQEEIGRAHV